MKKSFFVAIVFLLFLAQNGCVVAPPRSEETPPRGAGKGDICLKLKHRCDSGNKVACRKFFNRCN